MIRLGVVAAGPAVRTADGTQASAGDLILCTRNDILVEGASRLARSAKRVFLSLFEFSSLY
jgi:hypothetical protein